MEVFVNDSTVCDKNKYCIIVLFSEVKRAFFSKKRMRYNKNLNELAEKKSHILLIFIHFSKIQQLRML